MGHNRKKAEDNIEIQDLKWCKKTYSLNKVKLDSRYCNEDADKMLLKFSFMAKKVIKEFEDSDNYLLWSFLYYALDDYKEFKIERGKENNLFE